MFQPEAGPKREEVDRFVMQEIDTVPHLEALLLLWNSRPKRWRVDELAAALYIRPDATEQLIQSLETRGFIDKDDAGTAAYQPTARDPLVQALDLTYRRDIVRISQMIHAKAPAGIRAFADAFRFKRD